MKAKDVMTRSVISISSSDTIARAIRLMLQNHISGLPVIDELGRLEGMVTEGDFLRRTETGTRRRQPRWLEFLMSPGRLATDYVRTHGRRIGEVMTPDVVTVTEDTSLDEVVALMEKKRIKRVPVVRGDKVVGILSRANLLRALSRELSAADSASGGDLSIRDSLLAEIKKEKWGPASTIDVTVRDGVVDLWGSITDERERRALIVAAENIPGVKGVNDHVAWIEPMSGMAFTPPERVENLSQNG